ncbi:copper chaperone PCu(A)C [Streptomyces sp. TS71-3]|uniref:copper chaperone PCu(A)C n=1 Tax=Streptomyces sp. TS71-3 TaxID=2733862 RepID=UPI002017BDC0|nr:copper chaperone PCu(A)C [Streptomyces sp. TS71-3]
MRVAALALVAVAGCGVLAGCGGTTGSGGKDGSAAAEKAPPHIRVDGAYLPEPVDTGLAAGFLTVHDTGGGDTLTSVTSDIADRVTLHRTVSGRMEMQKSFAVPANGSLDFTRGGNHLMFERLTHKPKVGETVTVRLNFTRSGTVTIKVPVRPATYNPATGGSSGKAEDDTADTAGTGGTATP